MTTPEPRFDMRGFGEALSYAAHLHAKQTRKGSDLPYISHLLEVVRRQNPMWGNFIDLVQSQRIADSWPSTMALTV
jgi:hypothetical protein